MWLLFLLLAWVAAVVSCVRVCRTAFAAGQALHRAADAPPDAGPAPDGADGGLTLYETAYLSGGPHRLADVVLVLMAQQRRLHLAHTGWATVVDPVGQDPVERAALTAIGPEGQRTIPAVRRALSSTDEVRGLADRLVRTGLAAPAAVRTGIGSAIRQVQGAALVVLLAAGAAYWMTPSGGAGLLPAWFALPLILTLGTWAIARADTPANTDWATEAGAARLRHEHHGGRRRPAPAPAGLTGLALHGPAVLADPGLRAALHSSGA
ncbi:MULTISPECIES: TIGR04222 domain-containing membrane protein [unclassified Streptomyces]|uniref:TIGR04222 domain-containing membrane protein n=1 Tax=unclassified Streptomyces TaxID=2593676 RepID=UPI000C272BB8|nr:TIGR04222 domain-containing membrane protein [Streptomyces sp. CB02959]PJN39325.1 TIGR04222 domain-containing membrane protein [Streptomyces sp. CB02959]